MRKKTAIKSTNPRAGYSEFRLIQRALESNISGYEYHSPSTLISAAATASKYAAEYGSIDLRWGRLALLARSMPMLYEILRSYIDAGNSPDGELLGAIDTLTNRLCARGRHHELWDIHGAEIQCSLIRLTIACYAQKMAALLPEHAQAADECIFPTLIIRLHRAYDKKGYPSYSDGWSTGLAAELDEEKNGTLGPWKGSAGQLRELVQKGFNSDNLYPFQPDRFKSTPDLIAALQRIVIQVVVVADREHLVHRWRIVADVAVNLRSVRERIKFDKDAVRKILKSLEMLFGLVRPEKNGPQLPDVEGCPLQCAFLRIVIAHQTHLFQSIVGTDHHMYFYIATMDTCMAHMHDGYRTEGVEISSWGHHLQGELDQSDKSNHRIWEGSPFQLERLVIKVLRATTTVLNSLENPDMRMKYAGKVADLAFMGYLMADWSFREHGGHRFRDIEFLESVEEVRNRALIEAAYAARDALRFVESARLFSVYMSLVKPNIDLRTTTFAIVKEACIPVFDLPITDFNNAYRRNLKLRKFDTSAVLEDFLAKDFESHQDQWRDAMKIFEIGSRHYYPYLYQLHKKVRRSVKEQEEAGYTESPATVNQTVLTPEIVQSLARIFMRFGFIRTAILLMRLFSPSKADVLEVTRSLGIAISGSPFGAGHRKMNKRIQGLRDVLRTTFQDSLSEQDRLAIHETLNCQTGILIDYRESSVLAKLANYHAKYDAKFEDQHLLNLFKHSVPVSARKGASTASMQELEAYFSGDLHQRDGLDAVISVCILDGARRISILAAGARAICACDVEVSSDFSASTKRLLAFQHCWASGSIPWSTVDHDPIREELLRMIETVCGNHATPVVAIANDQDLDVMPWQLMLAARHSEGRGVKAVVSRIPSITWLLKRPLRPARNLPFAYRLGTDGDLVLQRARDLVTEQISALEAFQSDSRCNGVNILLGHGIAPVQTSGFPRLHDGSAALSDHDWIVACQSRVLVVNACSIGAAPIARPLTNLSSLRAIASFMGVTTLIAPVANVPPELPGVFLKCLLDPNGPPQIGDRYRQALLEDPLCRFYEISGIPGEWILQPDMAADAGSDELPLPVLQ